MRALFDTNILIDYLNGDQRAKKEMELYDFQAISLITYIEILVGLQVVEEIEAIKKFLHRFSIIEIDLQLANLAAVIRKKYKLKIGDSLILASAEHSQCLLVTRDTKDFSQTLPIVRIPYII
jgi:predicted nucleic acid-binding protein